MLEYVGDNRIAPTQCSITGDPDCGFTTGFRNVVIGLTILGAFIVKDASDIFFLNEYQWVDHSASRSIYYRAGSTFFVLFLQIITNVYVAIACGTKIVSSSLDLPETLSAAINAFFILEIDDALLPFLTTVLQPKGVCVTFSTSYAPYVFD